MRVLIDTNVVLDLMLNRAPFDDDADAVFRLAKGPVREFVSASAVTDVYYLARKVLNDSAKALELLKHFLRVVQVAGVSKHEIFAALDSDWPDFEDAVQNAVAESHAFDAIVTRNPSDFARSSLPVYSPADFLNQLNSQPPEPSHD